MGPRWAAARRGLVFAIIGVGACTGRGRSPLPQSGAEGPARAGAVQGQSGLAKPPSGRIWQEAKATGSLHDLSRLAASEGAAGLLEVAPRQDGWGLTALRALPYAKDALSALPSLCAADTPQADLKPELVSVLRRIVEKPPRDAEPMDPGVLSACDRALERLMSQGNLRAEDRDDALSAKRFLLELRSEKN
jgi:hypothetical protein